MSSREKHRLDQPADETPPAKKVKCTNSPRYPPGGPARSGYLAGWLLGNDAELFTGLEIESLVTPVVRCSGNQPFFDGFFDALVGILKGKHATNLTSRLGDAVFGSWLWSGIPPGGLPRSGTRKQRAEPFLRELHLHLVNTGEYGMKEFPDTVSIPSEVSNHYQRHRKAYHQRFLNIVHKEHYDLHEFAEFACKPEFLETLVTTGCDINWSGNRCHFYWKKLLETPKFNDMLCHWMLFYINKHGYPIQNHHRRHSIHYEFIKQAVYNWVTLKKRHIQLKRLAEYDVYPARFHEGTKVATLQNLPFFHDYNPNPFIISKPDSTPEQIEAAQVWYLYRSAACLFDGSWEGGYFKRPDFDAERYLQIIRQGDWDSKELAVLRSRALRFTAKRKVPTYEMDLLLLSFHPDAGEVDHLEQPLDLNKSIRLGVTRFLMRLLLRDGPETSPGVPMCGLPIRALRLAFVVDTVACCSNLTFRRVWNIYQLMTDREATADSELIDAYSRLIELERTASEEPMRFWAVFHKWDFFDTPLGGLPRSGILETVTDETPPAPVVLDGAPYNMGSIENFFDKYNCELRRIPANLFFTTCQRWFRGAIDSGTPRRADAFMEELMCRLLNRLSPPTKLLLPALVTQSNDIIFYSLHAAIYFRKSDLVERLWKRYYALPLLMQSPDLLLRVSRNPTRLFDLIAGWTDPETTTPPSMEQVAALYHD